MKNLAVHVNAPAFDQH